jgi:hypothetical protein
MKTAAGRTYPGTVGAIRCVACGFDNADAMRFCGRCGAALTRVCAACDTEVSPGASYCGRCGAEVGAETAASTRAAYPSMPMNPWLSIWTRPRATIRAIVDSDPRRHVMALIVLAGFFNALNRAAEKGTGDQLGIPGVIGTACVAAVIGIPIWYLIAAYARWAASLWGSNASTVEVRAAIAWAGTPIIMWNFLLWPLQLLLWGGEVFSSNTPTLDAAELQIVWGLFACAVVVFIWSSVVGLKTLAEVHGFTVAKTLGVGLFMLVPFLAIGLAAAAVMWSA